ncbi:hypothetical protein BRC90_00835 [Halobacteriales archaeon QS_4_69_34]|nr:MAG: hypothetical protein BRC90_00835 [Halobacteriales archaeon QS_4_69_34]
MDLPLTSKFRTLREQYAASVSPRHGLARKAARRWYSPPADADALDVMAEAWDTLVILDACRYDALAAADALDAAVASQASPATTTLDWVRATFGSESYLDTVYTTANGHYERYADSLDAELHAVEGVWQDGQEEVNGQSVVTPGTVTRRALDMHDRYPRKRHIVHYVQPHAPFLGSLGERFPDVVRESEWSTDESVTPQLVRRAYQQNLDLALNSVCELLSGIEGRVVISADHGELLGERVPPLGLRQYGHPTGLYHPKLVTVPWAVVADGQRETVAETPDSDHRSDASDEAVCEHLRALGYR